MQGSSLVLQSMDPDLQNNTFAKLDKMYFASDWNFFVKMQALPQRAKGSGAEGMCVFVDGGDGPVPIELDPDATVGQLRRAASAALHTGRPPRLAHQGAPLDRDDVPLADIQLFSLEHIV